MNCADMTILGAERRTEVMSEDREESLLRVVDILGVTRERFGDRLVDGLVTLVHIISSSSASPLGPGCLPQSRSTLARTRRNSATIWFTVKPLCARPEPCSVAAVRAVRSSASCCFLRFFAFCSTRRLWLFEIARDHIEHGPGVVPQGNDVH